MDTTNSCTPAETYALTALSPEAPCPMDSPDTLTRNGETFIPGLCGLLMFIPGPKQNRQITPITPSLTPL